MFSAKDKEQINEQGLSVDEVNKQIGAFKKGFPFLEISHPATLKDGLLELNSELTEKYIGIYEKHQKNKRIIKFVPASGAASRMFKNLFEFLNEYHATEEEYLKLLSDRSSDSIYYFFESLSDFAFYEDLRTECFEKSDESLEQLLEKNEFAKILDFLLGNKHMNYGNMPKGLIKFHKYADFSRTAVEEHLVESANCCVVKNQIVPIHFTVAGEAMNLFKKHLVDIQIIHEEKHGVKYEISYSVQDPSTDTIAVDLKNNPFREKDGSLLFRPGGHGALIRNLNEIDADVIFVKNIDNTVPDRLKDKTTVYKKTLAGILLNLQETIFRYLELLDGEEPEERMLTRIGNFIEKELHVIPADGFDSLNKKAKIKYFRTKLDRPIRVCGMVLNEGEPGGGPFFALNSDGTKSLQIVESSQIDPSSNEKKEIVNGATHFNPVDLVCGVKNYKGEKFNLPEFTDPATGFISTKSKDGKDLKALEWPGLWNGAMSDWITIFVEVPIETFNPVKIVNDLLREEHRTLAFL